MADHFAYTIARATPWTESALLEWWLPLSPAFEDPIGITVVWLVFQTSYQCWREAIGANLAGLPWKHEMDRNSAFSSRKVKVKVPRAPLQKYDLCKFFWAGQGINCNGLTAEPAAAGARLSSKENYKWTQSCSCGIPGVRMGWSCNRFPW